MDGSLGSQIDMSRVLARPDCKNDDNDKSSRPHKRKRSEGDATNPGGDVEEMRRITKLDQPGKVGVEEKQSWVAKVRRLGQNIDELHIARLTMAKQIEELKKEHLNKDNTIVERDLTILSFKDKISRRDKDIFHQQGRIIQRDLKVNEYKQEILDLKERNHLLMLDNRTLNELAARVVPVPQPRKPTYVPYPNPAIRNRSDYRHRDAPRRDDRFKTGRAAPPPRDPRKCTAPGQYGSNAYWDLGLCKMHFMDRAQCPRGDVCEWSHTPLDGNERGYVYMLGERGRQFLTLSDRILYKKNLAQ
ncbi:hypothetical protein BDW02DRAFT_533292 [Decorospora gaudefroyi]|uniref:C3H1-type domain-containing protein n=1 Tax=Decorospora gaudefroyi TaxID=184978 RepID=A0A6A5K1W7_9PLEO|nr:hypothetical protein BDW02DRAFT_533292 [Decorospora gaudefroyi]